MISIKHLATNKTTTFTVSIRKVTVIIDSLCIRSKLRTIRFDAEDVLFSKSLANVVLVVGYQDRNGITYIITKPNSRVIRAADTGALSAVETTTSLYFVKVGDPVLDLISECRSPILAWDWVADWCGLEKCMSVRILICEFGTYLLTSEDLVTGCDRGSRRCDDFRVCVLEFGVDFLNGACCLERNVVDRTREGHVSNRVTSNGNTGGLFHKYGAGPDLMILIILENYECVFMWCTYLRKRSSKEHELESNSSELHCCVMLRNIVLKTGSKLLLERRNIS